MRIITLINETNIGDDNNALGITNRLKHDLLDEDHIGFLTLNINDDRQADLLLSDPQETIIIGAGNHTFNTIRAFKKTLQENCHTIWSSHQIPEELDVFIPYLDVIGLPEHILDESKENELRKHVTLTKTVGVPHNLQPEELIENLRPWDRNIPMDKPCLFVILAGDAPTSSGKIKFFTESEAFQLGKIVAEIAEQNGYFVLATNGPRTGKYNQVNGNEVETAHRNNELEFDQPTDRVSRAFLDGLNDFGMPNNNFLFEDFRFLTNKQGSGVRSFYKAGVQATLASKGVFLIPGESTSMITECCDLADSEYNDIIVYTNNAMNPGHQKYLDTIIDNGLAKLLHIDDELKIYDHAGNKQDIVKSAAQAITSIIINKFIKPSLQISRSVGSTPKI